MRPIDGLAFAIVSILLVGQHVGADLVDFNNPVRSAEEDEVKSLPGLEEPLRSKLYAGYLNAHKDGANEHWLYYWFVESSAQPSSDPIVLWFNGGPGASSLKGAFSDLIGPFERNDSGFAINDKSSWNRMANLLFIESPIGVGFSYCKDPKVYESSDDLTADANYLALRSFMDKFPQYAGSALYLVGASYAGVHLPTLGVLLDKDPKFNLKGVAIRNGLFDEFSQRSSAVLFAYYHGLLAEEDMNHMSRYCCHGRPPTRQSCVDMKSQSNGVCREFLLKTYTRLHSDWFDESNLYGSRKALDALDESDENKDVAPDPIECISIVPSFFNFLADAKTREAIHVPQDLQKNPALRYCMHRALSSVGLEPEMRSLIESKRNLTMLVYNGNTDFTYDFMGSKWFVERLGREPLSEYTTWTYLGRVAGYVQHFDGITYATVHDSGHSVKDGKRTEAYALIREFLNSNGRNVDI